MRTFAFPHMLCNHQKPLYRYGKAMKWKTCGSTQHICMFKVKQRTICKNSTQKDMRVDHRGECKFLQNFSNLKCKNSQFIVLTS